MSGSAKRDDRTFAGRTGRLLRRAVPTLLLVSVIAGAYFYFQWTDAEPEPETAPIKQQPIPVSVRTVAFETVPIHMRFLGQTEAKTRVEVRARVAGYLQEWTFQEGTQVNKGDKLFQIDPRPFQVQLAQAEAGLASAEATLARTEQQLRRFQALQGTGAITAEEVEDWQTQQGVALAEVQLRKAEIAAAQLNLNYSSIESPITGMIGESLKGIGSYVDAGPNGLLAVIQETNPIYVRYAVTELEMLRFRADQQAGRIVVNSPDRIALEITLSDGSVYPHRGQINFVDVQIDQTTGTSVIRGEVSNPEGLLKPGQFIYATVLGVQRVNVIRVPQQAVAQSPTGAHVLIMSDGVAESRPVELGEWSGTDSWIINKGLEPGDRVITDRLLMVRPGVPVTDASRSRQSPNEADGSDNQHAAADAQAATP